MQVLDASKKVAEELEQIARHCYYAKQTNHNPNTEAHLDLILQTLGVHNPGEVGLSTQVLTKRQV